MEKEYITRKQLILLPEILRKAEETNAIKEILGNIDDLHNLVILYH